MTDEPPKLAYESFEELASVLQSLQMRLHYLNRVAGGESKLAWHYAELLGACARMAPLLKDKALMAEFGDGWSNGDHPDKAMRTERLLELLRERL